MGAVLEKDYYIHYYEVDYKKRCLISSLMNYLQDIAIMQSEGLGVGIDYLNENKIAWVIYKWDIKIERSPMLGETIKVRTYPYSFVKFYAYRRFEVMDKDGNIIVCANSMWLMINTESRKPVRIPENIYKAYGLNKGMKDTLEIVDANVLTTAGSVKDIEVRYSDIDTNRHVNNVKYVEWAMETAPMELVLDYTVKRIKVTYKKEAVFGEVIKAMTEVIKKDGIITCLHKICSMEGRELCILETEWTK